MSSSHAWVALASNYRLETAVNDKVPRIWRRPRPLNLIR